MKKLIYFERAIDAISGRVDIDPSAFRFKSTLYEVKHIRQKYEDPDEEEEKSKDESERSEKVNSMVEARQTRNLSINTQALQFNTQ